MNRQCIYLLLAIFMLACKGHYVKQSENFSHLPLKELSNVPSGDSLINPYRSKIQSEMNRIIGQSSGALTREGSQSTLGNFVCDAMNYAALKQLSINRPYLVLVNRGSLRNNLPEGNITVGNVFELMPFENELVLVEITGKKLLSGLKTIVYKKHSFYGLKLSLVNDSITERSINGRNIYKDSSYCVITSDYLANGGDSFNFFSKPISMVSANLKIRDAIIMYCEELSRLNKQIVPYKDDRLHESK